jgi:hypothetical protein
LLPAPSQFPWMLLVLFFSSTLRVSSIPLSAALILTILLPPLVTVKTTLVSISLSDTHGVPVGASRDTSTLLSKTA